MRGASWTIYAWPGLPQLWRRGDWTGLAVAVAFSIALNATILSTMVWTEIVAAGTSKLAWTALAVAWGGGAWFSWHICRNPSSATGPNARRDLFPAAISEYLQGNWFEAETACQQMLRDNDHDVDAHLLLATLFRQTGRFNEARRRLELLATLEGSGKWALEIGGEWNRLKELEEEQAVAAEAGVATVGIEVRRAA